MKRPPRARLARLLPWLALVRAPNLLTVPGDPLAGLALASTATSALPPLPVALAVALAAIFLYASGLILNDLCDVAEDARHRPQRPLPRSLISLRAAWTAWILTTGFGLAAAAWAGRRPFLTSLILLALIVSYNLWCRRTRLEGAIGMGLCRATALLLGAAPAGWPPLTILAALAAGTYFGALTWVAAGETRTQRLRQAPWVGVGAAAFLLLVLLPPLLRTPSWTRTAVALLAWAASLATAAHVARILTRRPAQPVTAQRSVGRLIHAWLGGQSALLLAVGHPFGWGLGLLLLAFWPVARLVGRHVSPS